MVIARQSRIHFGVFPLLAVPIILLFGVDPSDGPIAVRSIFRPAMALGVLCILSIIFGFVRSRGRLLVGGDDWIAEYQPFRLSPTANRVLVNDKASLKLRVLPVRSNFAASSATKNWVDLVVTTADGSELVHCSVNSTLLQDDYEEKFEAWKKLSPGQAVSGN